jgi:hypothetical protein
MLCPYYCLYSVFNKVRDKAEQFLPGSEGIVGKMEGMGQG